jgi:hypothetical protein
MRTMDIPPFPKRIKIADIEYFTDARLRHQFKLSEQAAQLAGYMFHPANEQNRTEFGTVLRSIADPLRLNLKGMRRAQYTWLRAADILHIYYDLADGGHQSRRGGVSISKAVHLAAKNTKTLGTSEATFWNAWKVYKDVAPVVAATVLIWDNARRVFKSEYLAAFRTHADAEPITLDKLLPFHVIMLMPELVLAVGCSFQDFVLTGFSSRIDAGLNSETLWRIPEDVNVASLPPPARNIRSVDKVVLDDRRAGNRGRRNRK